MLSYSINIQLILFITQATFFSIKDSWQIKTGEYANDRKNESELIYACYLAGFACFQALHWMYVS